MLDVVEKSLVGLYNKHKGNHTEMVNISQFVKSLGLSTPNMPGKLEAAKGNNSKASNYRKTKSVKASSLQISVSTEVMSLALKVLGFLKNSKNEYSELQTIPVYKARNGRNWLIWLFIYWTKNW